MAPVIKRAKILRCFIKLFLSKTFLCCTLLLILSADMQCGTGFSVCAPRLLSWTCGNNVLQKGKSYIDRKAAKENKLFVFVLLICNLNT